MVWWCFLYRQKNGINIIGITVPVMVMDEIKLINYTFFGRLSLVSKMTKKKHVHTDVQ